MNRLSKFPIRYTYLLMASLGVILLISLASAGFAAPTHEPEPRVTVNVSQPANGSYFDVGERPIITVVLSNSLGAALARADFATLNLYLYGPQDQSRTKTALALLNATGDRSQTVHHYISLLTNPDVQVNGNILQYTLQPVTTEEPGTYTASVYAVLKTSGLLQTMEFADL